MIQGDRPRLVSLPARQGIEGPAIAILMPTRGRPTIETLMALSNLDGLVTVLCPIARKGVVEARNDLAARALQISEQANFIPRLGWYALWIDDDAFWRPGAIARLLEALQTPGVDIAAGWFTGRSAYANPKAFYRDGTWPTPGKDCKDGDLVEIERAGFHFVMHRMSVLEKVGEKPFTPEGTRQEGEDMAFCERARAAGLRLWVHTGVPVAHVDDDGTAYVPGEGPLRVIGVQLAKAEAQRDYAGV